MHYWAALCSISGESVISILWLLMKIWKNKLKQLFPFSSKERQKELETYNIYSERFLRGLATRRTGKHNKDAFHKAACYKWVTQCYLL